MNGNLNRFAQNSMLFELPEPEPVRKEIDSDKSTRWARLKRKMGRPRASSSFAISPSCKSTPPISETDSEKYSTRVAYTPSTMTGDSLSKWGNAEYAKYLSEAVELLENDFVSGAREMADSTLSMLSKLIVASATTASNRDELWNMTVLAAKQLSAARPSMNAAIISCLLRALGEIEELWDMLDEKRCKSVEDLAAMARRQLTRILEKRKEAGIRLGENFAERLRAHCRQVRRFVCQLAGHC